MSSQTQKSVWHRLCSSNELMLQYCSLSRHCDAIMLLIRERAHRQMISNLVYSLLFRVATLSLLYCECMHAILIAYSRLLYTLLYCTFVHVVLEHLKLFHAHDPHIIHTSCLFISWLPATTHHRIHSPGHETEKRSLYLIEPAPTKGDG